MCHHSVYFTSVMSSKWFGSGGNIDFYCPATHVSNEVPARTHMSALHYIIVQYSLLTVWTFWEVKWGKTIVKGEMKAEREGVMVGERGGKKGEEKEKESGLITVSYCYFHF